MGYHQAGFDVIGVDINPQPNYPFEFRQLDALHTLRCGLRPQIVAIHASPPCQRHSRMSNCRPGLAKEYPDLIEPTRELLQSTGVPYVIENVEGSPLIDPVMLCGFMFGRELYRHRLFETSFNLTQPVHPAHTKSGASAGHWRPGQVISVSGNCAPIRLAREVMEIDWTTSKELANAIPPYFAEYVGTQLLTEVRTQ